MKTKKRKGRRKRNKTKIKTIGEDEKQAEEDNEGKKENDEIRMVSLFTNNGIVTPELFTPWMNECYQGIVT